MAISRVNTTELRVQVYNYLVDQILNWDLKPGDSIAESKLASEFNISRTPVREAVRQLAASGILESKPNCNTTVAKWNDEKILQLEIVRTDMENLAAKLAIIYGNNSEFQEMHKFSSACYEAGKNNNIVDLLKSDSAFHMEIAKIAKNDLLYKFLREVHDQIQFLLCWRKDFLISADKQYMQHEQIIEALKKRDEKEVLRLLTHHNRHAFKVDDTNFFESEFFL